MKIPAGFPLSLLPAPVAHAFRWVFLVLMILLTVLMGLQNLPSNSFTNTYEFLEVKVLRPLNLYTGGWRMFSGGGNGLTLSRTVIDFGDKRLPEYIDRVGHHTTWKPSTSHKILENFQGGTYTTNIPYIRGYLRAQCTNYAGQGIKQVRIEAARTTTDEVRNNPSFNQDTLTYSTAYVWDCDHN